MKRKYQSIKNYPGIYRVLVYSETKCRWEEPIRGRKYAASRYESVFSKVCRSKKHFKSFEDAKAFRQGVSILDSSKFSTEPEKTRKNKMLFQELVEKYAENELIHRAPSTQDKYRGYYKYFIFILDKPVDEINALTVDEWLAWLKKPKNLEGQNRSRSNFEHEYTFFRTLLSYYTEVFNPDYRMPFSKRHRENLKLKEVGLVQKDLKPEQFRSFMHSLKAVCLEAIDERAYYIACMQYLTYSRIQEAVALHYEDFDIDAGFVTLNKKIVYRRVKGAKPELHSGSKTSSGKRIILSPQLLLLFREWTLKTGSRSGPLFTKNDEWPSYRYVQHAYDRAFKAAGIPFTGTHIIRHASLTEAQDTCGDLKITQALAGHRSILTTERYAKVRDSKMREVQMQVAEKIWNE